ncbi:MAG: flagellar biosynthetic protein FliO [Hungatella sp.]|jgi:flagellar protein FliO/FliZ|nr:flagellar biosynthetic protein FliO [Hungatella sp.]
MGALTLFGYVLTVACVLLLAYWCSRLLARQWVKGSGTGNLQIIEQIQISQNQRILLLKAGDTNYLIGVSQAGIQMLAEVEGEFQAAEQPLPEPLTQLPFRDVLDKYLTPHQKKKEEDR